MMNSKTFLRQPLSQDGIAVNKLIAKCHPLDTNSAYCNLLQCTHFSKTCVIAEINNNVEGFISGYVIPDKPNTLFIWQVAVSKEARALGLASMMIKYILTQNTESPIEYIETTITESNKASHGLFNGIASKLGTQINNEVFFDRDIHFHGEHDSEMLFRIGPFLNDP